MTAAEALSQLAEKGDQQAIAAQGDEHAIAGDIFLNRFSRFHVF